ncbi:c-type cytochrome [Tropicimonas aquimaris]|uniref:C-type cytochrome n=1 Tax=Tropicimonas aquimaris TaxID=914152 RepID=A0ABW3ISR8_9RHOB
MKRIILTTILALWAGAGLAQSAGDAEAGKLLADQYCARCHDVSADGAFKQTPPSFRAISVYWGEDQIWSRIMFPIHTSMPAMWDFMMPENVGHVTAYILSLEEM